MISLTCTNCRAKLNIDDAFAGGVCRCKHCGTIQTVPSRLKVAASPNPNAANSGTTDETRPRTLYRRGGSSDSSTGSGTGLDDLANIVASSGLLGSGSGLTSSRLRRSDGKGDGSPPPRSLAPWLVVAGVVIVALLVAILWMSMSRSSRNPPTNLATSTAIVEPSESKPNFCGLALSGATIIYVIDRGNGTRDLFDTLKEVTYRSIESLGPDRKFQVIFWHSADSADVDFPPQPRYASKDNLAAAKRVLDDVGAFGQTDAQVSLREAFASRPDAIVLVTGKSLELDQTFLDAVLAVRKSSSTKIHTIALGDSASPILRDIATRTGGEYRTVSAAILRTYAE